VHIVDAWRTLATLAYHLKQTATNNMQCRWIIAHQQWNINFNTLALWYDHTSSCSRVRSKARLFINWPSWLRIGVLFGRSMWVDQCSMMWPSCMLLDRLNQVSMRSSMMCHLDVLLSATLAQAIVHTLQLLPCTGNDKCDIPRSLIMNISVTMCAMLWRCSCVYVCVCGVWHIMSLFQSIHITPWSTSTSILHYSATLQ